MVILDSRVNPPTRCKIENPKKQKTALPFPGKAVLIFVLFIG